MEDTVRAFINSFYSDKTLGCESEEEGQRMLERC